MKHEILVGRNRESNPSLRIASTVCQPIHNKNKNLKGFEEIMFNQNEQDCVSSFYIIFKIFLCCEFQEIVLAKHLNWYGNRRLRLAFNNQGNPNSTSQDSLTHSSVHLLISYYHFGMKHRRRGQYCFSRQLHLLLKTTLN